MAMGKDGMAGMGSMRMPLPDNTLPMMSGSGQFGTIEMGGMFTVVKVREAWRATITRIPAGSSIHRALLPTNGRARHPKRRVHPARTVEMGRVGPSLRPSSLKGTTTTTKPKHQGFQR